MIKKKIVFLTGTRADFGKLKSLIKITQESELFEVYIFATGMHMNSLYGSTVDEIVKSGFKNIYTYINHDRVEYMDRTLSKTIDGFSHYIAEIKPDLIVVHGDRVEAMAGAIVGSLNNILVAHIEGGEISGTIDELIRHSVSKLAHIHLVTNHEARHRLIQMGELESSIFVIGSPDLDLMNSENLPTLEEAKKYYNIDFEDYAIAMFHPITTEYKNIKEYTKNFVDALIESNKNYVLIYPNNDLGSIEILEEYKRLENNKNIKIFPSLRFEYFLKLLKNASFMIGNSSAGIREAPHYQIPSIDIGTRQNNRVNIDIVKYSSYTKEDILNAINNIHNKSKQDIKNFGEGNSDKLFFDLLKRESFWNINCQKQFQDLG
jgi:UDP-N-acetylglucosamine 2-epimerase (hydrolysing)